MAENFSKKESKHRIDVGFYKLASYLFNKLIHGKGSIKTLSLDPSIKQKKKMVAILTECFKYKFILDEIIEKAKLTTEYKKVKNQDYRILLL